jgi:predicted transcriptional regulator
VSDTKYPNLEGLYKKIKLLSNKKKFEILKATQKDRKNITELSKELNLAYNKCSDYVTALAKEKLVLKVKEGKAVYVTSNIKLSDYDFKPEKKE